MTARTVSLIVATRYRTDQLRAFLDSLLVQMFHGFEVIIVDQNDDERLVPVVEEYKTLLRVIYVRSKSTGKAAANNVGLTLFGGDIVAFPDDDCWYPHNLLSTVVNTFHDHPEWDVISGREASTGEIVKRSRFDAVSGRVTRSNVWRRHISFAMFFRRNSIGNLTYDERLGVGAGTIWGSGEETDFLLRTLQRGYFVQYDPSIAVCHPDWGQGPYTTAVIRKAHRYGMGMGHILQAHEFPLSVALRSFVRPLLGGLLSVVLCRPSKALYYWSSFLGRTTGWVVSRADDYEAARTARSGNKHVFHLHRRG